MEGRDKRIEELLLEKQDLIQDSVDDNDCQYGEVTWAWKGLESISEAKQLAYEEYKNPWTWFEIHSMDENTVLSWKQECL